MAYNAIDALTVTMDCQKTDAKVSYFSKQQKQIILKFKHITKEFALIESKILRKHQTFFAKESHLSY